MATLIDNWDVMGLRATGSIDYTIDDVFVPEAYTHPAGTKTPRRGGTCRRRWIGARCSTRASTR
jgi:alkylation response protein AidB-like acyl-CoA dehydrogenase